MFWRYPLLNDFPSHILGKPFFCSQPKPLKSKNATNLVAFSLFRFCAKLKLACLTRFFQGSHQATFAACGITWMDDVLACSFIQRFVRHVCCCFSFVQLAVSNELACALDVGACCRNIHAVMRGTFFCLPDPFFRRFNVSQSNNLRYAYQVKAIAFFDRFHKTIEA